MYVGSLTGWMLGNLFFSFFMYKGLDIPKVSYFILLFFIDKKIKNI